MKQRILLAVLAVALVPGAAGAVGVGIGAYGGWSAPILQDNAGNGGIWGLRAPVLLAPLLTVEPFYAQSSLGDVDDTFNGNPYTRSGPDVSTFGANVLLRFGGSFHFYPFAGIGSSKIEQSGTSDITDTSIDFGVGFGVQAMPKLTIDLRGELNSVITGDTSRKYGNLTAGVSYVLFSQ